MMINIIKYSKQVEIIKKNIKDFEYAIFQTVSTAKNVSYYWNDGYTQSFFSEIDKENQYTNELINVLYHVLSLMTLLSTTYSDINIQKQYLLDISGGIIDSDDFIIKDDDEETIDKKNQINNMIINAEDKIADMISKINVPYIKKLNFENLDIQKPNQGFIGMLEGIDTEIKKVESGTQEAKRSCDALKDSLYSTISLYNSINNRKISRIINELDDGLQTLIVNLENSYNYIKDRKNTYKNLFEKSTNSINRLEK